jgi:hypothetical protein
VVIFIVLNPTVVDHSETEMIHLPDMNPQLVNWSCSSPPIDSRRGLGDDQSRGVSLSTKSFTFLLPSYESKVYKWHGTVAEASALGALGMRKLLSAVVVSLVTFGLASPAWGQGGPPDHTVQVFTDTSSFSSENPCTGDPGIVTLNEVTVVKTTTFTDGSQHVNGHGTGTFDFDATNPAAADFVGVPEHPTNIQFKVDANGDGTLTRVDGYDARGPDGSRILAHAVIHYPVAGFTLLTPTLENVQIHCSP